MRSYKAARGVYTFGESIAWIVIVAGVVLMFFGLLAVKNGPFVDALATLIPGGFALMVGFFTLVYVQTARATVDSAEYAQQSLKLSRDQFELSKQMLALAKTENSASGYAIDTAATDLQNVSFNTDAPAPAPASTAIVHDHHGAKITEENGQFIARDKTYPTLAAAQQAIDGPRLLSTSEIERVKADAGLSNPIVRASTRDRSA